jgi:hypothetical protein
MAFRIPIYVLGVALFCAVQGGYETFSHASLRLTGERTTATLVDRITDCTVEYRHGQDRRIERMPCSEADAVTRSGASDVSAFRINKAVLEYMAAGGMRRTHVVEKVWQTEGLPLKAQIPALYRSEDPDSLVRAGSVWGAMVAFFGGSLVLAFAARGRLGGRPASGAPSTLPSSGSLPQAASTQQPAKRRDQRARTGAIPRRLTPYVRLSRVSLAG